MHKGEWSTNTYLNESFTLFNKTVGIVGGGNIGRQVARCVQVFGAKTQYYDKFRLSEQMEKEFNLQYKELDEILKTSDVITVHVPLFDDTFHMIGEKEISQMKDKAIIVNTSRGGLIEDRALLNAVKSGKLLGAGLDVVEDEPLKADDELLLNPNIVVTPHIGEGTADIGDFIMPMLVDDIMAYIKGEEVKYCVNKDLLKK